MALWLAAAAIPIASVLDASRTGIPRRSITIGALSDQCHHLSGLQRMTAQPRWQPDARGARRRWLADWLSRSSFRISIHLL